MFRGESCGIGGHVITLSILRGRAAFELRHRCGCCWAAACGPWGRRPVAVRLARAGRTGGRPIFARAWAGWESPAGLTRLHRPGTKGGTGSGEARSDASACCGGRPSGRCPSAGTPACCCHPPPSARPIQRSAGAWGERQDRLGEWEPKGSARKTAKRSGRR